MSILVSAKKRELEKKLVTLRSKLWVDQFHLIAISFCFFLFYPLIIFMIHLNYNIGIQFESALREKVESFESLTEEFNAIVNEYNSL